jgi:hypothetical protein
MSIHAQFVRPHFNEAFKAWTALLAERDLPTECAWIFDENLCFEQDPAKPGGFRLGYQIAFSPPPAEGAHIAFEYFSEFEAPLIFYRLGSSAGKSVCVLLCDEWFSSRQNSDGYVWRKEWLIGFRPGPAEEVEEVTDEARWKSRLVKNRPLHDLDFCMPLRAVHEVLAHGRVLTTYEHYALRFLHAWRRVLPS